MSTSNSSHSPTADAIKQTRPFRSLEHEAFVSVQRLAAEHAAQVAELLKPTGISAAQYNVLRILRGAKDVGLSCGEIGERLIAKDPDTTRLIDRLVKQDLAIRARDGTDRRVVTTRITEKGLELLASLDEPVADLHQRQFATLGPDRLRALLDLLDLLDTATPGGNTGS